MAITIMMIVYTSSHIPVPPEDPVFINELNKSQTCTKHASIYALKQEFHNPGSWNIWCPNLTNHALGSCGGQSGLTPTRVYKAAVHKKACVLYSAMHRELPH